MKGYVAGVRKEELSALTGFQNYQRVAKDIEANLVGIVTSDGVKITGFKTHFIDRVIGNYWEKREAVPIEDALDSLLFPSETRDTFQDGRKSRTYRGNDAYTTINPVDGILVQTNPARKKKK